MQPYCFRVSSFFFKFLILKPIFSLESVRSQTISVFRNHFAYHRVSVASVSAARTTAAADDDDDDDDDVR